MMERGVLAEKSFETISTDRVAQPKSSLPHTTKDFSMQKFSKKHTHWLPQETQLENSMRFTTH